MKCSTVMLLVGLVGLWSLGCICNSPLGQEADQPELAPPSPRIFRGQNASLDEFPWMSLIFDADLSYCGAAIIDRKHILTSARCFWGHLRRSKMLHHIIGVGCKGMKDSSMCDQRFYMDKYFMNDTLSDLKPGKAVDLLLVRLVGEIFFRPTIGNMSAIQAIDLQTHPLEADDKLFFSGFGRTTLLVEGGRPSSVLQKFQINKLDACFKHVDRERYLCDNVDKEPAPNLMFGDFGGGLVRVDRENKTDLVGIGTLMTSEIHRFQIIYSKVEPFVEWIKSKIESP